MKFMQELFKKQIVKFMLTGSLSTLLMFLIYVGLKQVITYQLAYFISYVITVMITYVLNCLFVFKTPLSIRTFLHFPIIYVVQYVGSAILLELLVRVGVSETVAPIIALILLIPLTFWLSRIILIRKS